MFKEVQEETGQENVGPRVVEGSIVVATRKCTKDEKAIRNALRTCSESIYVNIVLAFPTQTPFPHDFARQWNDVPDGCLNLPAERCAFIEWIRASAEITVGSLNVQAQARERVIRSLFCYPIYYADVKFKNTTTPPRPRRRGSCPKKRTSRRFAAPKKM
ncbi:hypothetical protein EVAR_88383_1 [Eumeta japonica]|uniref:Uncharacterized protein n=1 Tax=Eumeta variegata TaxID=151549 RepID=A0A4C1XEN3_EUMVA|nr:hypothetical protein EVAR_88383_1 [Eumeta japonica]